MYLHANATWLFEVYSSVHGFMHIYMEFIARILARRLVWYARAINQYKHVFITDKHCCEVHTVLAE
jgi:hypothetical protein